MNTVTAWVKSLMTVIARVLNKITAGHIKPAHITALSVLGHLFFLFLLAPPDSFPVPQKAAIVLVVFGLMDALDGALARVQGSSSLKGMFADAVSDRFKEVIVFTALASFIVMHPDYYAADAVLAVVALGLSLLVSYIKAKGEMAVAGLIKNIDAQRLNRLFGVGIARYEVRMALIVIGLLFPVLPQMLYILIVLTAATAFMRYRKISKYLKQAEQ